MSAVDDEARARQLGEYIRLQRQMADLSLRGMAQLTKVSNAYLSQVERGLHEPSISVLGAIADGLDVSLESLLARAGVIGGTGEADQAALVRDTEAAILGDPELSEAQRVALLSIYRSFVPARHGRAAR